MDDTNDQVTCSERVRMNAVAGLLFIVAGDAIVLYACFRETSNIFGMAITCICGLAAMLYGFYYLTCYLNKSITVSEKGVLYVNCFGKRQFFPWDQVDAKKTFGRNTKFIFFLNGKKVSFYGYARNAAYLHDWLVEHEHYDEDTMRANRKAEEEREALIAELEKKARSNSDY